MKKKIFLIFLFFFSIKLFSYNLVENIFINYPDRTLKFFTNDIYEKLIIISGLTYTGILIAKNDKYFLEEIQKNKNEVLDSYFDFFNNFGDGTIILAMDSIFLLGGEKEKKVGKKVIETILFAGGINYLLKYISGRKRPSDSSSPYDFYPFSGNLSFASGHTVIAFSVATVIGDSYEISYITYPIAFLCGLSRIYKNAHWPSDVFTGMVLGIFLGKIVNYEKQDIKFSYNLNNINISFNF